MKVYTGSVWQNVAPVATSITVSQISDLTATAAELNHSSGVTSAIQTQLDAKATTGKAIAMAMVFG
jgi:signal recognition particle GTPase